MTGKTRSLVDLPKEIIDNIIQYVPSEHKNLRLVNCLLYSIVKSQSTSYHAIFERISRIPECVFVPQRKHMFSLKINPKFKCICHQYPTGLFASGKNWPMAWVISPEDVSSLNPKEMNLWSFQYKNIRFETIGQICQYFGWPKFD